MEKTDVFQKFEDTETKRLQVIYLWFHGFTETEIRRWVDYAESTIKSYIKKFSYLLTEAEEFFYRITKKAQKVLRGGKQLVYLFKFYDDHDQLICSKVGTTTRLPEQRLKEEVKYYTEHGIPVSKTEICSVIDCGDIPCEGAESATRAAFIHKYPTAFCKNDRFFGVDIPTVTFNKVVKNYLSSGIQTA